MQHVYNRERAMVTVVEMTVEEIKILLTLAESFNEVDKLPDGVWAKDLRVLIQALKAAQLKSYEEALESFKYLAEAMKASS